jgi:hypothetical protein
VGYGPWFTAFKSTDGGDPGALAITTPPAGASGEWTFGSTASL